MYPYGERESSVDFNPHAERASEENPTNSVRSVFSSPLDNRTSLVDFLLTETDDVKERGGITREQLGHFVDLSYVATIFNINHLLNECGDVHASITMLAIAYFFILFTTRYHFDVYSIMFYSIDLVHRCLFLIFNLGVFVMTLNIKFTPTEAAHRLLAEEAKETEGYEAGFCIFNIAYLQGFASGYLASRVTLMLMYGLLIYFAYLHKEFESLKTYAVKLVPLLIASMVMIPIYWESVNPLKILLSVGLIEILGEIVPEVLQHYLVKYKLNRFDFQISMRPNVDHLQERLQEFFMIVLGESMIGLLINQFSVHSTQDTYLATLFSFTLMFSLGTHFLVCVHRSAEQVHAMKKKNALIRIVYIWMHPVICYIVLVATNALVQLTQAITHSPSGLTQDSKGLLKLQIGAGLGATVFLMVVMRTLHKGFLEHWNRRERVAHMLLKFAIALLHYCLYYIVEDDLYFILAESILTTSTNMIEMLIPLHTKSRTVSLFHTPTTVDSKNVEGAQHELNATRKSVLLNNSISNAHSRPLSKVVKSKNGAKDTANVDQDNNKSVELKEKPTNSDIFVVHNPQHEHIDV